MNQNDYISPPSAEIDLAEFEAANPLPTPAEAKPRHSKSGTSTSTAKWNSQLYPNSPLSGSAIERDANGNPKALYNHRPPNIGVINEKPEHRIMILLKAQGFSNREIAQKTEYAEVHVGQVLRQPWAKQRLLAEIYESGGDQIQQLLAGAVADSVFTLIEIRDKGEKDSDRLAAAKDLVDRYLGKPVARVESVNTNVNLTSTDIDDLQRKLEEARREEARLTGDASTATVSNDNGSQS